MIPARRLLTLLALIALASGGCALSDRFGSGAKKKQLVLEAAQQLDRGDVNGAAASLEKARELDPHDPDVLQRLGAAYLAAGREEQAFLPLKEAAEQPAGAGALLPLGRVLRHRKAYAEAEPVLKRALTAGDKGPVLVELGVTYWLSDRIDEARDTLEQAVAEQPDSFTAQFHLGEVYRRKEDWGRAREHLNVALKLDPESPYPAFALAEVLYAAGEHLPAGELYRKVIASSKPFPRIGRAYFQLAQIAGRKKDTRKALGFLDLAVKAGYDADLVALSEARLALSAHEWDRAEKAIAKVEPRAASFPQVLYLRGRLELARGRPDPAIAALREATKLPLDAGEVQAALGTALLAKLDALPVSDAALVDGAIAAFTLALRSRPRSHESLIGLSRIYALYKVDLSLAATQLKAAIESEPDDAESRGLLAAVLACQQKLPPALEQLDALPEAARGARRQFLRGAVQLALNHPREAEEAVVQGLSKDSHDLDGRLVLTAVYSRTGRVDLCRTMLARLISPASDSELLDDSDLVFSALRATLGPGRPPDPFRSPGAQLERRIAQVAEEAAGADPARVLELSRSVVGEFCMLELKRVLPAPEQERLRAKLGELLAKR